jgi:hypothetical protein
MDNAGSLDQSCEGVAVLVAGSSAARRFLLLLNSEPILLPVAPHSEGCEFLPEIDRYRGNVEEALFECLDRPSFFDEAVEMVLRDLSSREVRLPNRRFAMR